MQNERKPKHSPLISFLSGGIAGGVEATITYPFEFAKTRVQLRTQDNLRHTPRTPFSIINQVVRHDGFRALYKGCSMLVLGSVAKDGIRFLSFDAIKNGFQDPETGTLTPFRSVLAGMSAGLVSSTFASTPTERIKTALIDDARSAKRFASSTRAVVVIYQEQGFRGFYRGFAGTTLRQSSATACRMGSYNILKDFENSRGLPQSSAINFVNGAVAGTITTFATQPFDVIKTRSQSAKGATTIMAFGTIWRDDGWKGFWRGTTMRLGRTILSGGILFTVYEQVSASLSQV